MNHQLAKGPFWNIRMVKPKTSLHIQVSSQDLCYKSSQSKSYIFYTVPILCRQTTKFLTLDTTPSLDRSPIQSVSDFLGIIRQCAPELHCLITDIVNTIPWVVGRYSLPLKLLEGWPSHQQGSGPFTQAYFSFFFFSLLISWRWLNMTYWQSC